MFEWTNVTETCSYIQAPAKIGIVETGDRKVVLIDSGNDKDAGRKIHRMLRDRGLTLTAIYNTHSHADHIGGNQFLQSQYDCRIFAPEEELSFVLHPHLEPSFLYGGYPIEELRGKFLVARESRAEALCDAVLPPMLSTFSLPGHTFGMAGFRTEDDIVFLADCLCSKQALDKYGVAYVYDVAAYIRTPFRSPALPPPERTTSAGPRTPRSSRTCPATSSRSSSASSTTSTTRPKSSSAAS